MTTEEQTIDDVAVKDADDELAKARAAADEYLAGWKRATADYANLKKETERMREELAKYATIDAVSKFLPIAENLRAAIATKPAQSAWADGIERITAQLESTMKQLGVETIDVTGVSFDPAMHEAMMREKSDASTDTVIKILEAGYRMHGRVVRAAKVVVAE